MKAKIGAPRIPTFNEQNSEKNKTQIGGEL